ncbi:MAG: DUF2460 domain-containing protein [Proteobacteria bacterium]|nr:DUF2460 domain-containing protein [Pseudomonadota bacterium]
MAFWLATQRSRQDSSWIQRFDPRFWTVDFPRPMMAALTTPAADALRVDLEFQTQGDLAGLIWESADRFDHPLLAYATNRDYTRTTLSFRWRSSGVIALDAVNGPTLTIEGKDAAGAPHTWYVRLWNYAVGSPGDAVITLPFSALAGGWTTGAGSDPVNPAAIDRLFISMVPVAYVASGTAPLAAPASGWVELSAIRCEGDHAMVEIGDVMVPPTGIAAATAYDDATSQAPARIVRNLRQLGYRGSVLHYVGMSHFFRLTAAGSGFQVATSGDPLCSPARAWHADFYGQCAKVGFSPITSLSFELLAQHCPDAWQQRAANGDPARTGWVPPSALLSPANSAAMGWLRAVATAFAGLMVAASVPVRFQVGEPWWWIMPDGRICLYDDAAKAALGGSPVAINDLRGPLSTAQKNLLDAAGAVLTSATAALVGAVRSAAASHGAECLLLAFLPTVLDPAMPEARRANLPVGWASPAFDRLQLEDYDWLTAGADAAREAAYALINQRLGYAPAMQDYLAGFVAAGASTDQWRRIDAGIDAAIGRDAHEVFVWAAPQICRDGYVRLSPSEDASDMQAFDDVSYPLALGRDATVTPEFSTSIAVTASGFEHRNSLWSNARLRFDIGPGIRSEAELGSLIAFFRARRGAARGFRLRDPSDFSSNAMVGTPGATDQLLGLGDGTTSRFALVKRYGGDAGSGDEPQVRRITRPEAASLRVSLAGSPVATGWTLEAGGVIAFATPPAAGTEVRAGFLFEVPVRFAEDRLDIAGHAFAAGAAPSVPVIEIREAD